MTSQIQSTPYLIRQRNFPNENPQALGVELDKTYIDIASRVNERVIGVYTVNTPMVTGEQWYIQGQPQKQQTQRQIYVVQGITSISHGLNFQQISDITKMYGQFTDGTNWYGLIPGTTVTIAGQISFYLDQNNIIFVSGAGAPTLTKGVIVLEWISP